jgi:hypothetical protein
MITTVVFIKPGLDRLTDMSILHYSIFVGNAVRSVLRYFGSRLTVTG